MQSLSLSLSSSSAPKGRKLHLLGPERRCGISDQELASQMLSHAVSYLVEDQLAGRCLLTQANREAIHILCRAGTALASDERRESERPFIAAWIGKTAKLLNPHRV